MATDHMVLEAKKKFMLSIGKISLRDAEASQNPIFQPVPKSFFPLVDVDQSANQSRLEANSAKLTKLMISQAEDILKEIFARKRSFDKFDAAFQANDGGGSATNHLMSKLDHDLLELLVFTLGSISCQVSATDGLLKGELQADLQNLVQHQILTQIDTLINLDHTLFDSGLVAQGSSSLGAAGAGISSSAVKTV